VQFTVALLVGHFLFDVPIRGSLPLLYAITMFFILASLGVGLLISTVTRTQLQAFQVAFFYVLPNILLSGYVFPREAMPAPAQWIGAALPLTHYLVIVRSIVLKGVGFEYLWRETLILLAFSVGLMTLSVRRFAKTIE
jgi:ABC-2 type transport system permease protein